MATRARRVIVGHFNVVDRSSRSGARGGIQGFRRSCRSVRMVIRVIESMKRMSASVIGNCRLEIALAIDLSRLCECNEWEGLADCDLASCG